MSRAGSGLPRGPAEEEWVVLLDEQHRPAGRQLKSEVHHAATPLHLAFSVHLVDDENNTLLTRRALTKRTWPGVWSNTCCGHPSPGEDLLVAVGRRLRSELGIVTASVDRAIADFAYRAQDAGGVVENEFCPVFLARVPGSRPAPAPDPAEVADWAWVAIPDVYALARQHPWLLSPWSVLQFAELDAMG